MPSERRHAEHRPRAKPAVIYARVSTDEQAERGYSLKTQLEACRQYAETHNLNVVAEFSDDFSGAKLDRPGLDQVRDLLDQGKAGALVVYDPDRLSRKLAHSVLLREEWRKAGVELHMVSRGKSDDTPEGQLLENVQAVVAEFEREKIKERTRRGKIAKAEAGKPVMLGYMPYGYRRKGTGSNAEMVIHDGEAHWVRKIFAWYAGGTGPDGEPMSLRGVTRRLEREGAPLPSRRKKKARQWWPTTIRSILTNEIYAGVTYYGKTRVVWEWRDGEEKKTYEERPRAEWIETPVPELQIVDRVTWERAQERLERNKRLMKSSSRRRYLLSGFFTCGACGSSMSGSFSTSKGYESRYYRCGNHWQGSSINALPEERCPNANRSIATNTADALVWEWLENLLGDPETRQAGLERMQEHRQEDQAPLQARLERLDDLIDETAGQLRRLVDELAAQSDETVLAAIREKMDALAKQKASLETDRAGVAARLAHWELSVEDRANIDRLAEKLGEKLTDTSYEEKRWLFDRLNLEVVFRPTDDGRWLDVSCGFSTQVTELDASRSWPPPRPG